MQYHELVESILFPVNFIFSVLPVSNLIVKQSCVLKEKLIFKDLPSVGKVH